jgi:hypothetical protein
MLRQGVLRGGVMALNATPGKCLRGAATRWARASSAKGGRRVKHQNLERPWRAKPVVCSPLWHEGTISNLLAGRIFDRESESIPR